MGITITYLSPEAAMPRVMVDRRLWVTKDGSRLVEDDHPDAAILFCAPGQSVSEEEFNRYELSGDVAGPEEDKGEASGEASPEKKARRKPKDKAVAGPEENKGEQGE